MTKGNNEKKPVDPDKVQENKKSSDSVNKKNDSKESKKDSKFNPPSAQGYLVWLFFLLAVPLGLFFFHNQDESDILKSSEFEQALIEGRILSVIIKHEPASGSRKIIGEYTPINSAIQRNYNLEVIYTDALDQMIREHCKDRQTVNVSNFLSNLMISLFPILLLILIIYFLFARQIKSAGKSALQFGKSRARLNQNQEKITFADVAGIEEAQEEIEEIIDYLKDPEKFHKLGGKLPRGVLMIGPPGTGKTLLAKAIAGEADVPFYNISGSDFVEMFVGVGASRVRDMFEQGKKNAPCIIFIDEIDAVGRSRFSGIGGGHDEREQTLNALLVEMDGFEGNSGVIVIAATNRPDVLDKALLRPGRFDRQIAIDLPDIKGRMGILKVHVKKVKINEEVDMNIIARGTPGFSGADLANLINEAALLAARTDKKAIDMSDLEEARDKVRWGKERHSRKINEKDRAVTAYHEAGHALVGLHCKHSTPLHKMTIIPRGTAYLGATMHLPEEDRYTQTRSELIDELTVLMGGRVAEIIIFDEITSGAAKDIEQATNMARQMVCEWGMSEKMGMLNYNTREEHLFLGRDITRKDDYSEVTAREIDVEIKNIIDYVATRTEELLHKHKDQLVKLGKALLEYETMDVKEIKILLGFPVDTAEKDGNKEPSKSNEINTEIPEKETSDGLQTGDKAVAET